MNVRQRKLEARLRKENEMWEARLQRAAKKLEKDMNKTNKDVTMVDELEQTFYLNDGVLEIVDDTDEMIFVDEVTTEITVLPTFFRHPSLIAEDDQPIVNTAIDPVASVCSKIIRRFPPATQQKNLLASAPSCIS